VVQFAVTDDVPTITTARLIEIGLMTGGGVVFVVNDITEEVAIFPPEVFDWTNR